MNVLFLTTLPTIDSTVDDTHICSEGYNLKRRDRNRQGGGVAIYIRDRINYELRTDLTVDSLEALCIEVKPKCSKPSIVSASCRPPRYDAESISEQDTQLKTIDNENKEIILIGDVNCNELNFEEKHNILQVYVPQNIHKIYFFHNISRTHF